MLESLTLLLVIKKEGNDSQRRIWRDFSDAVDVDRIHMRPVAGPIQHIPESLSTYEFSAYLNVHMTGPGECTVVLLNTSIYNTPGFNRV